MSMRAVYPGYVEMFWSQDQLLEFSYEFSGLNIGGIFF